MLALLKAGQSVRLKVRLAGFFQIIKLEEKTIAVKLNAEFLIFLMMLSLKHIAANWYWRQRVMKNRELDQRPKIIEKLKEKVGNLLKI